MSVYRYYLHINLSKIGHKLKSQSIKIISNIQFEKEQFRIIIFLI